MKLQEVTSWSHGSLCDVVWEEPHVGILSVLSVVGRGQIAKGCVTLRGGPTGGHVRRKNPNLGHLQQTWTPPAPASALLTTLIRRMSLFTGAAGPLAWWERLHSALKFHWLSELSFLPHSLSLSCSLSLIFSHTKSLCDIKRCFAWIDHNTWPFTLSVPPPVVLLPWPIRCFSRKPASPRRAASIDIHPFILWYPSCALVESMSWYASCVTNKLGWCLVLSLLEQEYRPLKRGTHITWQPVFIFLDWLLLQALVSGSIWRNTSPYTFLASRIASSYT